MTTQTHYDLDQQYVLQNYTRSPLVAASGEGCYLVDADGKRYLDLIAGIGVNALGYAHPRITATLTTQAALCLHTSNLIYHPYQGQLAQKLCKLSGLDRVFFSNSGTEAMEAALKAVRAYGRAQCPQKTRLVALQGSFHGRTHGSLAVTGQADLRTPFEPLSHQVAFVEPNNVKSLQQAIGDDTAALILEPVLGEGGVYPLNDAYLQTARELTRRSGALLVADETQCGLGRTGRNFAYQWASILPDAVVTAKPLAAGLPLGATIFNEQLAACLPAHSHGTTFGGGPLACRVALEFLSVLDDLLPHVTEIAEDLRIRLEWLKSRHPVITEIRSKGLMYGIQLSQPGQPIVQAALRHGLLLTCTQQTVLRLLPPYILTSEQARTAVDILDAVMP